MMSLLLYKCSSAGTFFGLKTTWTSFIWANNPLKKNFINYNQKNFTNYKQNIDYGPGNSGIDT